MLTQEIGKSNKDELDPNNTGGYEMAVHKEVQW